jgi:hypothetical protein
MTEYVKNSCPNRLLVVCHIRVMTSIDQPVTFAPPEAHADFSEPQMVVNISAAEHLFRKPVDPAQQPTAIKPSPNQWKKAPIHLPVLGQGNNTRSEQ